MYIYHATNNNLTQILMEMSAIKHINKKEKCWNFSKASAKHNFILTEFHVSMSDEKIVLATILQLYYI